MTRAAETLGVAQPALTQQVRALEAELGVALLRRVGRNIALSAELMEPARMYAWIVFVIVIAIALNMLLTSVENRAGRRGGAP